MLFDKLEVRREAVKVSPNASSILMQDRDQWSAMVTTISSWKGSSVETYSGAGRIGFMFHCGGLGFYRFT